MAHKVLCAGRWEDLVGDEEGKEYDQNTLMKKLLKKTCMYSANTFIDTQYILLKTNLLMSHRRCQGAENGVKVMLESG